MFLAVKTPKGVKKPFPAPAGEDHGLLLYLRQAINWAQELDMKVMQTGLNIRFYLDT